VYFQGCSSSLSHPGSLETKSPIPSTGNHTPVVAMDTRSRKTKQGDGQSMQMESGHHHGNVQVNHTHILILSKEKDSSDSSSIVSMLNNNNRVSHTSNNNGILQGEPHVQSSKTNFLDINHSNSLSNNFTGYHTANTDPSNNDEQNNLLPCTIKSALKTGRTDPEDHMISNRPIKTVTFVDSVTVVTVH